MINKKKLFSFNFYSIFIILLFFCILFFISYSSNYIKKHFDENVLKSIENLSIENSININTEIDSKFSILKSIANTITKKDLSNPKEIAQKFNAIVKASNFENIDITTPDGTCYTNTGETLDISDKDYFKQAMEGENFVSSLVVSTLNSKNINIFSIPIFEDNEIIGVLTASISTEEFCKNISFYNANKLGFTFIIDQSGNLIAHENNIYFPFDDFNLFNISELQDASNSSSLDILQKNIENSNNGYIKIKYNNDFYYIYYTKLDYSDWWLLTPIPYKTIQSTYSHIIKTTKIINILIILLLIILFSIILNKERKNYNKLKSISYIDSITNGKNDLYLKENIYSIIKKEHNYAFCSLEIINIKNLISILGVKRSNFILKEVYIYLNEILNNNELVVHSYLGEYKLILKYDNIKDFLKRLDSIDFHNIYRNINFKIGIYFIDKSDINFENMCSYSSMAKEALNTTNSYLIYNKKLHQSEIYKMDLKHDIKLGIENKQFKAWFQPKYDKDGQTIVSAEALVRWYKYGSIISPYIFVPMCEKTGLIKEVDQLIFEDVCKNLRKWIDENKKVVPISINLSRAYLDKANFIDTLKEYLDTYKIPTNLIQFEITESALIENEEKLKLTISLLRKEGFKILLDDFGVGYSSIKTISDIDFDAIKIDKSFISKIGKKRSESLINYTISLAHSLGIGIVAEGVETKEQYEFLLNSNCNIFQGYYFNKPMSAKDFSELL